MKVSDIKEWAAHPVTVELFASLCTLAAMLVIMRHEDRIYRLEATGRDRAEREWNERLNRV